MAVQDQIIATRVIEIKVMHKSILSLMCRVCGSAEETIVHLLAACPTLAPTAYLRRHNLFAAVTKEDEKINNYCCLAADFHQMYNMPVTGILYI